MPPKGSRGGRASRGRGRGTSGTAPATPADPTESLPVIEHASAAAEESQDVTMQNTPTLPPASIPIETPATIPNRPPTQRLDSFAPGRGRGRGRGRGAPVAGAAPPTFKPKAVRRDQSERQKAADEERKRVEERNRAAEMAEGRADGRGRGASRGTRGRGDAMGKRNNYISVGPATGLFSLQPKREDKKDAKRIMDMPSTIVGSSGYDGYSGSGNITSLAGRPRTVQQSTSDGAETGKMDGTIGIGRASNGAKIKKEIPEPIYPGLVAYQGQRSGRVNIENINMISDDEDEDQVGLSRKGKGRANEMGSGAGGLKPIRVLREEHQDRVMVVNTEASGGSSNVKEGDMTADDDSELFVPQDLEAERLRRNKADLISRDATGKPWAGVWSDTEDEIVLIKPDPDAVEAMDIDSIPAPISPESPSEVSEPVIKKGPSPRPKPRVRRSSGLRDKNPVLQTDEDRAEWLRHQEDIAVLAQELGGLQTAPKLKSSTAKDVGDDANMDQEEFQEVLDKEGRLYLFQFPPIMPPLYNLNHVKKETAENDVDITEISSKPAPGTSGSSKAPIDISKSVDPNDILVEGIKTEPGNTTRKTESQTPADIIPEEGFVGRLVVRESGAVELDWGGTDFVLSRGASHDFLMTTLLMDGLDVGDDSDGDASKRHVASSGLGSVMGKFVVTPDWDKIF